MYVDPCLPLILPLGLFGLLGGLLGNMLTVSGSDQLLSNPFLSCSPVLSRAYESYRNFHPVILSTPSSCQSSPHPVHHPQHNSLQNR